MLLFLYKLYVPGMKSKELFKKSDVYFVGKYMFAIMEIMVL